MSRLVVAILILGLSGCSTTVTDAGNDTQWITAKSGVSFAWADHEFVKQANAVCPNGYEVLDERRSWGLTATISKLVRCR